MKEQISGSQHSATTNMTATTAATATTINTNNSKINKMNNAHLGQQSPPSLNTQSGAGGYSITSNTTGKRGGYSLDGNTMVRQNSTDDEERSISGTNCIEQPWTHHEQFNC